MQIYGLFEDDILYKDSIEIYYLAPLVLIALIFLYTIRMKIFDRIHNIDLSELRTIQELGRTLGLSESQIVDLVKHSRNIFDLEHQDRGKT